MALSLPVLQIAATTKLPLTVASATPAVNPCRQGMILDLFCDSAGAFIKFGAAADLTTSFPLPQNQHIQVRVPTRVNGPYPGQETPVSGDAGAINCILTAATGNLYITPMVEQ